jgi:hypothetical protein
VFASLLFHKSNAAGSIILRHSRSVHLLLVVQDRTPLVHAISHRAPACTNSYP